MPKSKPLQTNFSSGELTPNLGMRRDTKQYRDGAKSLLNSRVLIGGGVKRRPGSWWLYELLNGDGRVVDYAVNQDTQYILIFSDGQMHAFERNSVTGFLSAAGSLTGCPWTSTTYRHFDMVTVGNTIIITHANFMAIVQRVTAVTWSLGDFPWYTAASGRIHQPHFKIAELGNTITPSALTGSVTLTTSVAHWGASYVGQYVRILDRELLITGYTNPTVVTATVLESLRPYQDLTVTSSASFAVDDVVEGETSAAVGVILSIPDATSIIVVIVEGLTKFEVEDLIGPQGVTAISAVANATPAGSKDWTEQLFSDIHGYAVCVEIHRNRILFGGNASAPNAIAGSSIINVFDFDIGEAGDSDGFLETIGDSSAVSVVALHSAEQLLVITDKGPYYVPESAQSPFRPTALAFNHFGGTWPCSAVEPHDYDGGVIYVSSSIIIKMAPTGGTTAVWTADEKSFLCPHLINTPVDMFVTDNFGGGPERYAGFINLDGTMAIMQLSEAEEIRNFVPWETDGFYRSGCSAGGYIYVIVEREIAGSIRYFLEMFAERLTLDFVTEYANKAALDADVYTLYAPTTVSVVVSQDDVARYYLGIHPIELDDLPTGEYQAGLMFDRTIETLPPNIEDSEGNHSGDMMRIVNANVHVLESARFTARGRTLQAYQMTDDLDEPPPLRTGPRRFNFLGWSREPTIVITQPDPLPLTVLGIGTTVAY